MTSERRQRRRAGEYVDANPLNTANWGMTQRIAAGIVGAAPGPGGTPSLSSRTRVRPVDVREVTASPGWHSRDMTAYIRPRSALPIDAATGVLPAGVPDGSSLGFNRFLIARVQIGVGGITRTEEFALPMVGKAIHATADSLRIDCIYSPTSTPPSAAILQDTIGWTISGGVGIGNLLPGITTSDVVVTLAAPATTVVIPQFSERLLFQHPTPGNFDLVWQDEGGNPVTTAQSGVEYASARPIPVAAFQVVVTGLAFPTDQPFLTWERPS